MHHLEDAVAHYVAETRKLDALPRSTETTFYPDIKALLAAVLKAERLPFEVITGTSETREKGRDMPDFVLGDASWFVGVYGEVKLPGQDHPRRPTRGGDARRQRLHDRHGSPRHTAGHRHLNVAEAP